MTQIMTCYMSVLHVRQDVRIAFQKRMYLMGWEITHKLRNNMISNANTSNAPTCSRRQEQLVRAHHVKRGLLSATSVWRQN
jgi:hypothetical protein